MTKDPRRLAKGALVLIHWIDAAGNAEARWVKPKEAVTKPGRCETVGWIVHVTDKAVTVVHNRDTANNNVHGDMTIPVVAITKVRFLGGKR